MKTEPEITLARLSRIAPEEIVAHMSDPRVTAHMPLATRPWDMEFAQAFVATKEAAWARDGLGHWALLADGDYAGWGGFQKEGADWDFGLVLRPEHFGLGRRITRLALDFARQDPRIPYVTFLLAPTRRHLRGLERVGAEPIGQVAHAGKIFVKYRLETPGEGAAPEVPLAR